MLLEAQKRGWEIRYMQAHDLFLKNGRCFAQYQRLEVQDNSQNWFTLLSPFIECPLADMDIVLMRKDPPFDMAYITTTYLLELAEQEGCLVVNKPASLRDCNEKLFTSYFPQCCVDTLVTNQANLMHSFIAEHKQVIIKPLNGMGGESIFKISLGDGNTNVILESVSKHFSEMVMLQRFIADISKGDKRILIINGLAVPYALARIPKQGENRGNIAAGGEGIAQPLSERDQWICEQIAPDLKKRALYFVGIDVIGDYLTEINVTSPTCIRELDQQCQLNISAILLDELEQIAQQ